MDKEDYFYSELAERYEEQQSGDLEADYEQLQEYEEHKWEEEDER